MAGSTSHGPKGPGRILGEATPLSPNFIQISQSDPQPEVRRRKPYQDHLDEGASHEKIDGDMNSVETNAADEIPRRLRMVLSDGTKIDFQDRNDGIGSEMIPGIMKALFSDKPSSGHPDTNGASSFAEHYITLAPLPRYHRFDFTAYLLSKDHYNNKNTSQLKVPSLYSGYDIVTNTAARVTLFLIAEKCQFLDNCMAELFKALIPSLPQDIVEDLLSRAKAVIVESDPNSSSTGNTPSSERRSPRSTYLGELGHHLESMSKGKSREFTIHRIGDKRLNYLQDGLELPYWDLIIDLYEAALNTKQSSGVSQAIMDNAVAGCYQFIKSHLNHLKSMYASGEIKEAIPKRVLKGIALRLRVLEQYTQAIDPIRQMDVISSIETSNSQYGEETTEMVPESGEQVVTFSILFIGLAIAMVPGMIGFSKAAQDGEIGSMSDADFSIVIRDTIMTILGAALSTAQIFGSSRKNSAYSMAWAFTGLAVLLSVIAIIVYSLANKAFSSLCGFFAQFFSIASLAILVLDRAELEKGARRGTEMDGAGITSKDKKSR